MWNTVRAVLTDAVRDLVRSSRSLALTDIAYKVVAFALLTPGAVLLLRWLMSGGPESVIADADILKFFVTTRAGVLALVVGGAVTMAITALELACLMAIGLAAAHGKKLDTIGAVAFGASRALHVLALTGHMVLRILLGALPFLLSVGLVYWALLRGHDINYYLAERPPAFWAAGGIAAVIVAAAAALLVRAIARWALALPLVLFENVIPRRALGESAQRSAGDRSVVLIALASWVVVGLALLTASTWIPEFIGRGVAPHIAGSVGLLLLFVSGLVLLWGALGLAVGIVNASLLALVVVRLYLRIGEPREPRVPEAVTSGRTGPHVRIRRTLVIGGAVIAVLAAIGLALLAVATVRRSRPVMVIAHRGSSATAPENTLAAFRLAVEQGTDFVELDVQESADGEVLVVHDSDLMKAGGAAMKIWETDAARIRSVDIGSRAGSQYSGERVPTLAEALAVCKGKSRVIIELKSYGHDQRLEERIAAIVEAAGMGNDCVYMSLDHGMVRKMKRLRPSWRSGVLAAKAIGGELTSLGADFLAVESKMATARFVRRAHRAGQQVYVWTVDDPAWMLALMSRGVDGLITNKPDVAREVVTRRAQMSDAQRVLVALLVRLGARTEALASEDALRP
jgi:glycerophosphoryl diester phosphodiesterase